MDLMERLDKHKDKIILLALVMGLLKYLDMFIPETLPFFEAYTNWLYLGIIGLATYLFWDNYWGKNYGPGKKKHIATVPVRNVSNPAHQARMTNLPPNIPSSDIFDNFKKE